MVIIPALISGILATIITLFWQNYSQKKEAKNSTFNTLMAYRFCISDPENVKALNSIQVVFYKSKNVQQAWKNFKQETDKIPCDNKRIEDSYIKLLEEVGKVCGYRQIVWHEIKDYYFPMALSEEINENNRLRKANLQRAEKDLNNQQSI